MSTAAIVLAAGGSRRFACGNKLTAELHGRPLATWAIERATEAEFDATIVVVGATEVPVPDSVTLVRNLDWPRGLATSLQAGIQAADDAGHDAVVVGLADQPGVLAQAWKNVAGTPSAIAVASYDGGPGHPVRLAREVWALLPAVGDAGARELITSRPDLVTLVPCPGTAYDIDTREDLQAWI